MFCRKHEWNYDSVTSDLSALLRGHEMSVSCQGNRQALRHRTQTSVDLWVAEVFTSELGLVPKLFLDSKGQRSQRSAHVFNVRDADIYKSEELLLIWEELTSDIHLIS